MLWLVVIVLVGGLLFVMFRKPAVHPVVSFASPLSPPTPSSGDAFRAAVTQPSMSAIHAGELEQLLAEQAGGRRVAEDGGLGAEGGDPEDDVPTAAFVPVDLSDLFAAPSDAPRA